MGQLIGSFIATFLLSRLCLWLVRKFRNDITAIAIAHACAFAIATVLAGFGNADGGSPNFLSEALLCFPSIVVWFLIETVQFRKKNVATPSAATTPQ